MLSLVVGGVVDAEDGGGGGGGGGGEGEGGGTGALGACVGKGAEASGM